MAGGIHFFHFVFFRAIPHDMPPRVAPPIGAAPSPLDAYWALPPITRTLATAAAALALVSKLGLVSPYALVLTPDAVLGRLQVCERKGKRERGGRGASFFIVFPPL